MTDLHCNLCREIHHLFPLGGGVAYERLVREGQNKIMETEDFLILPSLGPLNRSHAMIVPKKHVNSFALLSDDQKSQAAILQRQLSEHVFRKLGHSLMFFESGSGKDTSHSGGCIIHAHIHCCFFSNEFERRLFDEVEFTVSEQGGYEIADTKRGYVWYRDVNGRTFVCNSPQLPSQFLRYLYSQVEGDERYWNWRRHFNFEGILEVISTYQGVKDGDVTLV